MAHLSRKQWIAALVAAVLALTGYFLFKTPQGLRLSSRLYPANTFREAVARIRALRGQEPRDMNPACSLQFMNHGKKMEGVVLFVHGYTSCPQQFHDLGKMVFDRGFNVVIAPLPHHGLADRLTEDHAQLTAEELSEYVDTTVDAARGLGTRVIMVGISAGGVTVARAAQFRSDIDRAVIISPALGFKSVPAMLTDTVSNLFLTLPNYFNWWDAVKQASGSPVYSYPRYASRALAEILRLGSVIREAARNNRPAARSIVVVTNANDPDVNGDLIRELTDAWRGNGASVTSYEFDASLRLDHDFIDPLQPNQKVAVVYPRLVELITER